MIPHPDELDAEGGDTPRASDLLFGVTRTMWAGILAGAAVLGLVGFLLWGANSPSDPVLSSGPSVPERTSPTPADGLDFAEVARRIGEGCLRLLVADTPEERASGLRHRERELDRVDGMLFAHDAPQARPGFFTMAGVVEPLEVGFYGPDGTRTGGHRMEPCAGTVAECPSYDAPAGWQLAVETAPGKLPEGNLGPECEP